MTARNLITSIVPTVNADLVKLLVDGVKELIEEVDKGVAGRELENAVWDKVLIPLGRALLEMLLAVRCLRSSRRAHGDRDVGYRLDENYTLTQSTTLGRVRVPLFAYREGSKTRCPSRAEVFPLHPACRSSELLLEWEARTGCSMPFRQAEEAIDFYSHGAVRVEDTTINRHISVVGAIIDHTWTCRLPEDVAKALDLATRDGETGRPLLYVSSDAHALRRYVDDTWNAEHKMINGVRLWCENRKTGETVHLGGAYTWGDCREVAKMLQRVMDHVLPNDEAKQAYQVVFVSDGVQWIRDHLFPTMPRGTRFILDFYHVLEHLSEYAASRFGPKSAKGKKWVKRAVRILLGKRSYRRSTSGQKRKGHRKSTRQRPRPKATVQLSDDPHGAAEQLTWLLIEQEPASDKLEELMNYLAGNSDRADYPAYRARGIQIGSGAMESFHKTASQTRLKVAGARWTAHNALAVLNTRLMWLARRWEDFWSQPDLTTRVQGAFLNPPLLAR